MHISPFFQNLRSAYMAELEDLSFDSEGLFILNRRLAQRRDEIEFLVHMLEISPEMVAAVFHKAFSFTSVLAMNHLLTHEPDKLPDWENLAETIEIAPWADTMVQILRKQPAGDWFMSVAAALEYMTSMPNHPQACDTDDDAAGEENADHKGNRPYLSADDADDIDGRTREEAGADFMVEQGFDRKD